MYIKLTNGTPTVYSIGQLKADNPQVSFPAMPTEACLAEYNVFLVETTPAPVVDYMHVAFCAQPAELVDGKWVQVWSVRDATHDEWSAKLLVQRAGMRAERDALLAASDWTQVADSPVDKTVWAVYRQALRDITTQQGFPFAVLWPELPA